MGRIGMPEVILILAVFLLFFGAKKLPEVGGAIGKAVREFKRGLRDDGDGEAKPVDDKKLVEDKKT